MLLRMQKYDVQLVHRKGTQMDLADTLSRAYLQEEVTPFELGLESINMAQNIPISAARLEYVRAHAKDDPDLQTLALQLAGHQTNAKSSKQQFIIFSSEMN